MFQVKDGIVLVEMEMKSQYSTCSASPSTSKVTLDSFLGNLARKLENYKSRPTSLFYSWRNLGPIKISDLVKVACIEAEPGTEHLPSKEITRGI